MRARREREILVRRHRAGVVDTVLGGNTDYLRRVKNAGTEHDKQVELARILALHAVGLIVIDEFQNICVGRHVERKRLARFLVGIMENMSTRVMLVGTPEAHTEVVKDLPLMRRAVGENGQIEWDRITDSKEWTRFLTGIWRYQYTATPTPLTTGPDSLAQKIHDLSFGIPDLAVKLYRMAQYEIIGTSVSDGEILQSKLFEMVAKSRMRAAHALLQTTFPGLSTLHWDKPENQAKLRDNEVDPEESAEAT